MTIDSVFFPELSEARLENAFQKANAFCVKEALRSKQRFDRTAKSSKLLPGDLVLVKKKEFTSKHKIADKWESEPYEIVLQRSDRLPVYTVIRNDRELFMLFLLGLWHDTESILDDTGKSESSGNPVEEQVDNFLAIDSDGEVDQSVYEGPQTRSHVKQPMKANVLIDQLFDINSGEFCGVIDDVIKLSDEPVESIKDLILQF